MRIPPHTFIFMEGDPGNQMFIIRSGKVRIMKREGAHMATLAELGPGSILGEMSLLDQQPRSATAKTLETTELAVIDQSMLDAAYQAMPSWLTTIIRMMVRRLRETTSRKYANDLRHAVPALLFLLQNHENHDLNDLAAQIEILYGLSYNDMRKLLDDFADCGLVRYPQKSSVPRIAVEKPGIIRMLYQHFLDAASPRPKREYLLNPSEQVFLDLLWRMSETTPSKGRISLVPASEFWERLPENLRENPQKKQLLNDLLSADRIQTIPKTIELHTDSIIEQIGIERDSIAQLLEFNRILSKLNDLLSDTAHNKPLPFAHLHGP